MMGNLKTETGCVFILFSSWQHDFFLFVNGQVCVLMRDLCNFQERKDSND